MEKFVAWWKRDKRYMVLAKSLLLAFLPVLCCLVYCASHGGGKTVGQIYLPNSESGMWNDELFYYKQVESVIHYGYPQGYFGFDESHALKLSFAAWSPVLLLPWILWGLIFGWNLLSPILCNIFLMSLCCFLFVWLVRPAWKQMGILSLLFFLYAPFVRYMLSGMAEVNCFCMLILFYALAVNYQRRENGWKLALLFVMSAVMMLMRPYFLLLLFLPAFFWIRKSRLKGIAGSALVIAVTVGLYAAVKHYLSAPYFAPLFFTDWITAFWEQGVWDGILYTMKKLCSMGKNFILYIVEAFREGYPPGAYFAGYMAMLGVFAVQSIKDYFALRRQRETEKDYRQPAIEIHFLFSLIAMLIALLLMYKLADGSRHLLAFIAAGIFLVSLMENRFYKKAAFLGLVFFYFYSLKAVSAYYYQAPFVTQERQADVEEWTAAFQNVMELEQDSGLGYDNVVIWAFSDTAKDGGELRGKWQLLYGLPKGFGISCCMPDYLTQNFALLKSRYLFIPSGGEIEELCIEADYRELWRDEAAVLYCRY